MTDNILNFGEGTNRGTEEPKTTYEYEITYETADSTETVTQFGDAIVTASFIGFVDDDQILHFMVPIDRVVFCRLIGEVSATKQ